MRSFGIAFSTLFLLAVLISQPGLAQTFNVIHNFTGGADGASSYAGLTIDRAGNLYGTTYLGGSSGYGTVFKLTKGGLGWALSPLYGFQRGQDGANPQAKVIFGPDGRLYGTTTSGGGRGCPGHGCGTVFSLAPPISVCKSAFCPWTEAVLYQFTGSYDGADPLYADVAFDKAGNLFGTTSEGGVTGGGTAFEMLPSGGNWTFNTLYSFYFGRPEAGIVFDKTYAAYGTTSADALYYSGTVFELALVPGSGWTESNLYFFHVDQGDGAQSQTGLIFDQSGNLYGTNSTQGPRGSGTVFELTPSNGSWTETVLYAFEGNGGGPAGGSLVMDAAGNLYGTTTGTGTSSAGVVFKLTPSGDGWIYTSLHDFTGGLDGEIRTAGWRSTSMAIYTARRRPAEQSGLVLSGRSRHNRKLFQTAAVPDPQNPEGEI